MPFEGFDFSAAWGAAQTRPAEPPPAGLDLEDEVAPIQVPKGPWNTGPKPPRRDRSKEYIDVRIIEDIMKDDNGLELQWLQELLEDGVRVLNHTGRYLKPDRFLKEIEKRKALEH